jgi:hypothetical protein
MPWYLLLWPLFVAILGHCADQDILTILGQQSGISTFIDHLQKYPDLIDTLNGGSHTGMLHSTRGKAWQLMSISPRPKR